MTGPTFSSESPQGTFTRTDLSILYRDASRAGRAVGGQPACFRDLLLDQVVDHVVRGQEEFELKPFFYDHLSESDDIRYRHDVWRDIEIPSINDGIQHFVEAMKEVRQRFTWSRKTRYPQHRNGLHLDSVIRYCDAVERLRETLASEHLVSEALRKFNEYLTEYASSDGFLKLARDSQSLRVQLSEIQYCVNLKGPRIRVIEYDGEADFGVEIEEAFERFQQGSASSHLFKYSDWPDMNHVESSIADRVARLFPGVFESLQQFRERTRAFLATEICTFERELHFYLSYLDYIAPMKSAGLSFCIPVVSRSKEVRAKETFDIGLSNKLVRELKQVVCNDLELSGIERIFVVSGPNQGGKTTFARTFGQLHFLGSLGCPVPGTEAQLFLFEELFTHFGREEDATYQSGKLEDDLLRIQDVIKHLTANSVVVMNEIFSSTTSQDALALGTRVLKKIIEIDALCVVVSFIDELTTLGPSIVSLTSSVNPDDPVERTFKIIRHPADGLAYAIWIAEKYGLTYDRLKRRVSS